MYRRDGALYNAGDALGLPQPSARAAVHHAGVDNNSSCSRDSKNSMFLDPGLVAALRGA